MRLVIAIVLVPVMLGLAPSASGAPQNNLTPTVTCVDINGDGTITGHFGYGNVWKNTVNVPAGNTGSGGGQNQFVPAPADRGQPGSFAPGTFNDVFTVTFSGASLEWRLSDLSGTYGSATASSASPRCTPVPAAGVDSPWIVGVAAIALGAMLLFRRRTDVRHR